MIELKATLFNRGNMAEYIRDVALNDNRSPKPLPACRCGNTALHIVYIDEERTVNVGSEDRLLTLKGVPRSYCDQCGRTLGDLRLAAKIETVLDDEILWRLNRREIIPEQLEFESLLSVTH
ncbi:hypothetical protein [Cohnella sp. AR92]|uniref:hypothetical protein n=1 Tax=Cohnella sp. AR92 TaxID=648716 RepID=UPI000F8C4BC8|nr:hypothetical protein [Cohnella sp. AR92]RUS44932.1 hypothetical protein ELR57_22005 [Cohnella sp. AR92]